MLPSRCLLLAVLLCFPASQSLAAARAQIPKVWQGELMEGDEGAFYVQSFMVDLSAQGRQGSFRFTLQGRRRQIIYVLQTQTAPIKELPDTIWKLKDDDYDLLDISMIDEQGMKWSWKGPYKHPFAIRPGSLSSFGIWYLVQLKQTAQLKLLAKPGQKLFPKERIQGAFSSIIDAQSHRVLLALTRDRTESRREMRQAIRSSRTIAMYYQLNLFRQNAHAASMSQVLQANDPDIRSCYTDLLERGSEGQGRLGYTFVYSSQTHSIKTLKVKTNDLKDETFMECMMYKIMGFSFAVDVSLIGELNFDFKLGDG